MIEERFELITERLHHLDTDAEVPSEYVVYFQEIFGFVKKILETYEFVKNGEIYDASIDTLSEKNQALFEDIFPGNYEESYFNP